LINAGVNAHILTTGNDAAGLISNAGSSHLGANWLRSGLTWASFDPRQGNAGASAHYVVPTPVVNGVATSIATLIANAAAAGMKMVIPVSTGAGGGGFPTRATYTCLVGAQTPVAGLTLTASQIAIAAGGFANLQVGAYVSAFTGYTAGAQYISTISLNQGGHGYDVATISGSPTITTGTGISVPLGSTFAMYAAGLAWLVAQTGMQGQTWEVMNEYNSSINNTSDADYAALIQAVYPVVKAADPTCTIMAGAITKFQASSSNALSSYNALVAACTPPGTPWTVPYPWDKFSIHTYKNIVTSGYGTFDPVNTTTGGQAMGAALTAFQAAMVTAGDTAGLWVTEMGWNTDTAWVDGVPTQAEQASFITTWMSYLFTAGVEGVLVYELTDEGSTSATDGFGLMSMPSYVAKTSFGAVQALIIALNPVVGPPSSGGTPPAAPAPPTPRGVFTYYSFDLLSLRLLAELPYTGVGFSHRLNTAGAFSAQLQLSDPGVMALGPIDATNPSKTLTIVDLDGQIVWGGINWTRNFDSVSRKLQVAGQEAWSYFARRFQAEDYTTPPIGLIWSANPADGCSIAAQVIRDAIAKPSSALQGLIVKIVETVPNPTTVVGSYPLTQLQTVESIVSSLSGGGFGTGFDFGIDWAWSNGRGSTPVPTLTIAYPRRGRPIGSTSPVLMTGGDASIQYTWPEDGSKQANSVSGTASGSGNLAFTPGPDASVLGRSYPLLEKTSSLSNVNTLSQLRAAVLGDWAQLEWPVVTPQFTMPVIGDPSLGDFLLGDDERIIISPDERFPAGADTTLRVVAVDVKILESGVSTMTHTMNTPPGLAPVPAPPN
jgi:hypothetical protein